MQLPKEIKTIISRLNDAGFEAYAVGGCVRDLLRKANPPDWDITTNAPPEKLQELFPESFYENSFGTVTVRTGSEEKSLSEVQITPYRIEAKYTDKRHPDEIQFAKTLSEDLSRRDFTMNAMAIGLRPQVKSEKLKVKSSDIRSLPDSDLVLIDVYDGQEDLKNKLIRTVGNPEDRFGEDALRMMRAVRFATTLGFVIEPETLLAIKNNRSWLRAVSQERIRDEFVKILNSENAYDGILLLRDTEVLEFIVPELTEGIGVEQNLHHIYTVWEHNILALKYTVEKKYSLAVRLAALLHDVGKPRSKRGEGKHSTFYGHEVIGGKMAEKIMARLKFSRELADKVTTLVRYHLFYYNVGEVTESSVRRLLANVGKENMEDLLKVREADRIGSGTPKAVPYKLRHLKFMLEKVSRDPISPKMLKMNGTDIMKLLNIEPGPRIGILVNALMGEVLDDPAKNERGHLERRLKELSDLSEKELLEIAKGGKMKSAKEEEREIGKIKRKHAVS